MHAKLQRWCVRILRLCEADGMNPIGFVHSTALKWGKCTTRKEKMTLKSLISYKKKCKFQFFLSSQH